jgi:hypothetical protein
MNDPVIGNPVNLIFVSDTNHALYDWHNKVRVVRPDNSVSDIGTCIGGKVYVKRAWFLPARAVEGIPILDITYQSLKGHNINNLYNKLASYVCNEGEFGYMVDLLYNSPGCVSAYDAWKYEDPTSDHMRGKRNRNRILKAIARFVEYATDL